ncbi:hypothetical protein ACT7DM_01760 [Bacillus cereus]
MWGAYGTCRRYGLLDSNGINLSDENTIMTRKRVLVIVKKESKRL